MTAPRIPITLKHEYRARWRWFWLGVICGLCISALWVTM